MRVRHGIHPGFAMARMTGGETLEKLVRATHVLVEYLGYTVRTRALTPAISFPDPGSHRGGPSCSAAGVDRCI